MFFHVIISAMLGGILLDLGLCFPANWPILVNEMLAQALQPDQGSPAGSEAVAFPVWWGQQGCGPGWVSSAVQLVPFVLAAPGATEEASGSLCARSCSSLAGSGRAISSLPVLCDGQGAGLELNTEVWL